MTHDLLAAGDEQPPFEDRIAVLEAEIEALRDEAERCRKVVRISKGIVAAGVGALLLMALGVLRFDPLSCGVALTAVLGGIPLHGSNASTRQEALATARSREEQRAALIDRLGLETVENGSAGAAGGRHPAPS